jgi:transposase
MVKQERLDFLADSPFYTKRFAFLVGRRCRVSTIQDVARETHLNWKTVKALEMQYMQEQLRRAGTPGPRAIGVDEISIRKGHTYRIVVSDLARRRPIWFWRRGSVGSEPRRVLPVAGAAEERQDSAGGDGCGRRSRSRRAPTRRRRRFSSTSSTCCGISALRSGTPAAMLIERHWDGIAAYCESENKISLGFVEGLNTKIRVLQRRACGLRDPEYLRLKILTCMLPEI